VSQIQLKWIEYWFLFRRSLRNVVLFRRYIKSYSNVAAWYICLWLVNYSRNFHDKKGKSYICICVMAYNCAVFKLTIDVWRYSGRWYGQVWIVVLFMWSSVVWYWRHTAVFKEHFRTQACNSMLCAVLITKMSEAQLNYL